MSLNFRAKNDWVTNVQNKEVQKDPFHGFEKRLNKRLRFCWCRKSDQKVVTESDIFSLFVRFAAFLQNLSSRLYCDNNRMSPIYLLDCVSIWFPWFCRSGGPPNNFSISMTSDNGTRLPHWNCCAAVQKCFTNVLGKSQESQIQLGHHQKKCIAFSDGSAFLPTLIGRSYYDFCPV